MPSTTTDRIRGANASKAVKAPADLATTANITLSGEQTIDGTTTSESRVLVKDQTDASENGIYDTAAGAWERAADCDGPGDLTTGTWIYVAGGTANGGNIYILTTTGTITIGTTNLTWSLFNTGLGAASAFVQTLLDDTTAAAFMTTLGITTFIQTLLDDSTASAARSTLDVPGNSEIVLPRDYIAGLICSNGTDTDHDIDIAVGEARDASDTEDLVLSATLTKQIDAAWAVGDDAGGLDTGSVANTTLYAVWLIKRTDTDVVDALFSTSFTSPTMPTNYDKKRLIGTVKTDGSANIISFQQVGDYFRYLGGAIEDVNDSTITSVTWETGTLSVPPHAIAQFYGQAQNVTSTSDFIYLEVRTKGASDATGISNAIVGFQNDTEVAHTITGLATVLVNSSRQIEYLTQEVAGAATIILKTVGFWMPTRRDPL